ncbi:MAG TPA: IPT/TIG domain-containing protein, partial [Anaerolineales bacterium]
MSNLTPSSAIAGTGGFTLTVEGVDFKNDFVIRVNGTDRTTAFIDSTQLSTLIAASEIATAGTLAVTVFDPNSTAQSVSLTFTINNPVPELSTISPSNKTAGSAPFTLTLNGTNFRSSSVVRFNGSPRATTFISVTQLSAQILATDVQTTGVFPITVVNPTPGGGSSLELDFSVNNPVPVLNSISPNNATAGGGPFTLTLTGTNFVSGAVVRWNGANRTTTVVSGTQATAQITSADLAAGGTFNVTVTNPSPGGGTSGALSFAVNSPVPTLSTINPTTRTAGGGLFTLTITGTNFVSNSVVRFNGSNRPTTFVSSTQVTAQIAAADTTVAGSYPMTVFNPTPGGGLSSAVNLAVNNPVPTITTLSPASKMAGDPGFTLTVNGSNFNSSSTVRFNATNRTTTLVSSSRLTAQITAADIAVAGAYPITVFNAAPAGGTSNAVNLTVATPPVSISTISPSSRPAGGLDFVLTVTGTNFTSGSVVQFNGTARVTTFVSATQITATILAADVAAAGAYPIAVVSGGSTSNVVNLSITP